MIQKIILSLFILFSFHCTAQTMKTVTKLEIAHQDCLDTGIGMKNCSITYYYQSDSLLNLAYKNLRLKLSSQEKSKLRTEQLGWLKKRDQYFRKVYIDTKKEGYFEEGSSDFDMVIFDLKADYVFVRVKELIKRI